MKKRYLSVLPSFILLITMFVSTTHAWFADFVYNQNNRTTAGTQNVSFTSSVLVKSGNLSGTLTNLFDLGQKQSLLSFKNQTIEVSLEKKFYFRVRSTTKTPINYELILLNKTNIDVLSQFDLEIKRITGSTSTLYAGTSDIGEQMSLIPSQFDNGLINGFEIFQIRLIYVGVEPLTLLSNESVRFVVYLNSWYTNNPHSKALLIYKKEHLSLIDDAPYTNVMVLQDVIAEDYELFLSKAKNFNFFGSRLYLKSFHVSFSSFQTMDLDNGILQVQHVDFDSVMSQINHRSRFSLFTDHMSLSLSQGTYRQHGTLTISDTLTIHDDTQVDVYPSAALYVYGNLIDQGNRLTFLSQLTDPKLFINSIASHRHPLFFNEPLALHYLSRSVRFGYSFQGLDLTVLNHLSMDLMSWTPLGTQANPFQGNLNGNGYELRNLTITDSEVEMGFVGYNQGTIRNIKIKNILIVPGLSTTQVSVISPLVFSNTGTIDTVTINGMVYYQDPNKVGHSFEGWFETETFEGSPLSNETIDGNYVTKSVYLSIQPTV
jgi:hypothetical protein